MLGRFFSPRRRRNADAPVQIDAPVTTSQPASDEGGSESAADPERTAEPALAAEGTADSVPRDAPAPRFMWPERDRNAGEAEAVTIGAPSTFGAADWWSSGWWPAGDARGDVHADLATAGVLAVAGITLRGNKHRLSGEACEDSFHIRLAGTTDDPVLCVAVCDGVGSAAKSRLGAEWLSHMVTAHLAVAVASTSGPSIPDETMVRHAVESAVDAARARADRQGIALEDLQTTLTFAVIPAAARTECTAVIGQIGDSPAFIGIPDGWEPAGATPEQDETILSTRTHDALSAGLSTMQVSTVELPPGGRLLLCSDGVGNFVRSSAGMLDLGTHLARTLRTPVPLVELIRQADFDLRSADDDRTMVVVWRRSLEPNDR